MKKFIFIISLLMSINSFSQKYVALSTALFTNAGSFKGSFCPSFEIGKKWEVYSLGLNMGKMNVSNQHGNDTTIFIELRNNLNVYQQGKFSNNLIIGAGYLINSDNFISELSTGIGYTPNNKWIYNIYIGTYYFKGNKYGYNNNFFGTSVIYIIK